MLDGVDVDMTAVDPVFSLAEMHSLKYTAIAVSALSFIGSALVIWSYFRFEKLQKFAFTLVVMLAVSDLGSGIAFFIGSPPDGTLCTFQGVILHYCQLSSFLMTTVIAFVLERTVCRQQGLTVQKNRKYLYLYAWGVPLLFVLLPFTTASRMPTGYAYSNTFEGWSDSYDGAWCWIADGDSEGVGTSWRFLTFYVPLWLAMFYNLWSYNKVIKTLKITLKNQTQVQDADHRVKLKIVRRLRWYPALLVVCWTFATINRVQNAVRGRPLFTLYILHVMFSSAQGLCNSVVYGLNKGVQAAWRDKYPQPSRYCDSVCNSLFACCTRFIICSRSGHEQRGLHTQTETETKEAPVVEQSRLVVSVRDTRHVVAV